MVNNIIMARINIIENIFEKKVKTFNGYDDQSIEAIIRECTEEDVYSSVMCECYDCETGETFAHNT